MPMSQPPRAAGHAFHRCLCPLVLGLGAVALYPAESVARSGHVPDNTATFTPHTKVSLKAERWCKNSELTYRGTRAEGLLMNVRMVNSVFEDRLKPDFDPEANTSCFLSRLPDYAAHGVTAFTICLRSPTAGSCQARLTGERGRSGHGIPADARSKPGSGGQMIAFVPSLDLVITRQTGSSGEWPFEEYLRQTCAAVIGP